MIKKSIALLLTVVSLTATANVKQLTPFTGLVAQGPFHITLTQGNKPTIDFPEYEHFDIAEHHHVLYLVWNDDESRPKKPVDITLTTANLDKLVVAGQASLLAKKVDFPELTLRDDSDGAVKLLGHVGLQHLDVNGSGDVSIAWVHGKELLINGLGSGTISLGGAVDTLYASIGNQQKFHAKYLRVNQLNVKTMNVAEAKVAPVRMLNAFAHDQSAIYYYQSANNQSVVVNRQGKVLSLAATDK